MITLGFGNTAKIVEDPVAKTKDDAQPIFVIVNVPLVHPDAPEGKLNVPLALVPR